MKALEYNFNPKKDFRLTFGSFSYEPPSVYEEKLGNLYMIGLLKNALPQQEHFLANLAKKIKDNYYKSGLKKPEAALNAGLQHANSYLDKLAKDGDVSWLGNLSFAVLAIKNQKIHFTKTGDIRIFLLRQGGVIDLEEGIKFPDIEPYPLRVFGNLASGGLEENDAILASTKEVNDFITKEGLDAQIAAIVSSEGGGKKIDDGEIEVLFNSQKEQLDKISGTCLIIALRDDAEESAIRDFSPIPYLKKLSLREAFSHKNTAISKFKFPKFMLPALPNFPFLKSGVFVLLLISVLAVGFLFSNNEKRKQTQALRENYQAIAQEYSSIEGTQGKNIGEVNNALVKCLANVTSLTRSAEMAPDDFRKQVENLKSNILASLDKVNKVEAISNPIVIFEFKNSEFVPQRILGLGGDRYFYNPDQNGLYLLDKSNEGKMIASEKKFAQAAASENMLLFFIPPNKFVYYTNGNFSQPLTLRQPYAGYNFDHFYSYKQNLYFVDKGAGKITKYPHFGGISWDEPQMWLPPESKKPSDEVSMAFDKNAWLLNSDGTIDKYYLGKVEKTYEASYYPPPKDAQKIWTSADLPYLYILDSAEKRIIILDKNGELVKQIKSDNFSQLLDFEVSPDGKTLWLLDGLKLYQLILG